jgi:hypothetical protein
VLALFTQNRNTPQTKYVLPCILLACLVYRFFYFLYLQPGAVIYNSDSVTYFADVHLLKGIVDAYRTPVYPLLLQFFGLLSKTHLVQNLIWFQQIISFLSIVPFFYCAAGMLQRLFFVIPATLFFGCWHLLLRQNITIGPECLSIAGSTCFLWLAVKYNERPSKRLAFILGLFPLILIMLKPVYLSFLVVAGIFLLFRRIHFRNEKMITRWGLSGWLLAVIMVLAYCQLNKQRNGSYTLSRIAVINSLGNIIISGAYKQGGDQELIAVVDTAKNNGFYNAVFYLEKQGVKTYQREAKIFPAELPPTEDMKVIGAFPVTPVYSNERIDQFISNATHNQTYIKYILHRAFQIIWAYKFIFIVMTVQLVMIFSAFKKYRKISWLHVLCISLVLAQFATIIIGGIDDIDRLLIPAYPFGIILWTSFFLMIPASLSREKILESIP